jgi:catechol 2,3-dioxygenase-like lactoylglutathione lyase family enzyme
MIELPPATLPPPPIDSGWTEVIVSVSDLERATATLAAATGWSVRHRGPVPAQTMAAWGWTSGRSADSILMGEPGAVRGLVRLVAAGDTRRLRSSALPWEAGGWAGINVRVADIDARFRALQALSFQGFSDPVQFEVPPYTVRESMLVGPDGLVLGLIERVAPPLADWPYRSAVSRPVTLFATVADPARTRAFFAGQLQWAPRLAYDGPAAPPGMNLFALPHDRLAEITRRVDWWHPGGGEEGTIATIAFSGVQGRYHKASGPGLGLVLARIPVSNARAFCARMQAPLVATSVAPWGPATGCVLESPDGARMEIFTPGSVE